MYNDLTKYTIVTMPAVGATAGQADQRTPSPTESLFSPFPLLPTELQIQIWKEAALVPRVVLMERETADLRCAEFLQHRQSNP